MRKADRREKDGGLTPERKFGGEGIISGFRLRKTPLSCGGKMEGGLGFVKEATFYVDGKAW